ncbi:Methylcrotonoyl-CoA carboxylase subunit alpha like protein [Verticillium longisporum]|uniref:Methylcrotonoyl-CoA carboxylase subunit alpha like protein n=1 Tax=Verticillium longisporum TaxID=100787 RepID=A0A8I3ALB3_VERLO|nr:Methylcrotonoyl-CoA carboxylase subunit alpha like protein [Verticillium longisporum]
MRSMKAKHRLARPLPRLLSTAATGVSASAAPQITPITSLLIANRGEIALRIHKTADRLGIRTTTLYTDPDASSQHAACSPHSLSLGNPKAYLDGDRIISLAKQHGIQALHPGYGFLSENPAFASRCEKEGIVFVGPPAKAMHDMGDKARSKEIMTAAGVPCRGAAIEARIYAESPEKGFMPDSGKLVHLTTPATDPDVRIDAGFVQGDTVSEAYDGMIAKLIVRGRDRETAIRRLELALRDYEVVGLSTNIEFLKRMCRSPAFIEGDVETGFIEKWKDELFAPRVITDEVFVQAALGSLTAQLASEAPHGGSLGFGAPNTASERSFALKVLDAYSKQDGEVVQVTVSQTSPGMFSATVTRKGAEPVVIEKIACTSSTPKSLATKLTTFFPGERIHSTVVRTTPNATETQDSKVVVFQHGVRTELALLPPKWFEKALGLKEIAASVVAPMPCKVLRNEVAEGEVVKKGAPLVVIESMKMETVIRSPQDGVVKKLTHKEGDICKAGTVLVLFEEEAANEAS